jgi:hypothetical protein
LDGSKYKDKFTTLLEPEVYELLPKDSTDKLERKVYTIGNLHIYMVFPKFTNLIFY